MAKFSKDNIFRNNKKLIAATMLVNARSVVSVARAINLNIKTLEAWLKQPEFVALVNEQRDKVLQQITDEMVQNAKVANKVIRKAMKKPTPQAVSAAWIGAKVFDTAFNSSIAQKLSRQLDAPATTPQPETDDRDVCVMEDGAIGSKGN